MINPSAPDFKNTPVSNKRPYYHYRGKKFLGKPYVTIITAFHNTGTIFHETAKSIFNQSFQQWEWIIVNDFSTREESLAILNEYRDIDKRLTIIDHRQNLGPGAARNTAVENAHTDYIVQLDSDNLLEPTAIEKWLWFLESHKIYSFVKGYSVGFDKEEYLWDKGFYNNQEFLNINLVDITSMIKKEVYINVGGYDLSIRDGLEDWDFWLNCARHGYWGGTVTEYLDWYRRRKDHSVRWLNWDEGAKQKEFRKKLKNKYKELWNGKFPIISEIRHNPNENISDYVPFENKLNKEKQRILFIIPWLTTGGSDKFTLDLVSQLIARGWEVSIVTTKKNECTLLHKFAQLTQDIFILTNFLRLPDYPRFLSYLVNSRDIDVILFTQSELGYLLLPFLRSLFPDIPFIDYCHIEEEYWKNGGYPGMSVKYNEFLDRTIVSSHHLKNWMTGRGADENKIEVCYTNIDHSEWKPDADTGKELRNKLNISEDTKVILYAGRMVEQKQPRVFAKTIKKLSGVTSDFTAIVAGDGEYSSWLRKFSRENKLDKNIVFLGLVSNEYIKKLMCASDIFFLPSKWEGIALSVYEAMSCGVVVVGANVGGQGELVSDECGFLVDRSDEDTESDNYSSILNRLVADSDLINKMGHSGRNRVVNSFGIKKMGDEFNSVLNEIIENMDTNLNRIVPPKSMGIISASNAIETVRLSDLAEELWQKGSGMHLKERLFLFLKTHLDDTYCKMIDSGWKWLEPIKDKLKNKLIN